MAGRRWMERRRFRRRLSPTAGGDDLMDRCLDDIVAEVGWGFFFYGNTFLGTLGTPNTGHDRSQ